MNIKRIRKNILERLEDWFCYDDEMIVKEELVSILDTTISDKDYVAIVVEKATDIIDKDNIFGKSAKEIYDFLLGLENTYGKGYLNEGWSGYESNYLEYCYKAEETEEEVTDRLYEVVKEKVEEYSKNKEEKIKRDKEIADLELKLAALKRKS